VIADSENDLEPAELERRRAALAALKVHPREQDLNRAALARGTRCYEQYLGDRRQLIGRLVSQFEAVLDRQDPREIETAREQFTAALDQIDGERYL
jgi:molecular chaperone HscC